MGNAIDKSKLGYLGIDFQYKLVKCFIEEPQYFTEISNIVDSTVFTDSHLREFVGLIKNYYEKENLVPSYNTIKMRLNAKATSELQQQEWGEVIDKLKSTTTEDWEWIKDNALKFFRTQAVIKAANKVLEKAGSGNIENLEDCIKILEEAWVAGKGDDFGHSIYDLLEAALSDDYTVSIPTGIDELDSGLGGGLDKGKLGLIICALGVGKTTLSTALASNAASHRCEQNNYEGWKVLQIYFEDDDVDMTRKHIGKMTNIEACNLKHCSEDTKATVLNMMKDHPDADLIKRNLKLIRFRTGEVTASQIKEIILRYTNRGFKPDLVIVDYFECLAPEKGGYQTDSEWSREGKTIRTLENIAKDLKLALWVPTQGGRDSIGQDFLQENSAGGSIKKSQAAQVIVTVGKTVEQARNNRATIFLAKNRGGKAKLTLRDVYFNNGTCDVRCDDMTTYDDTIDWKEEKARMDEENRIIMAREALAKNQQKNAFG